MMAMVCEMCGGNEVIKTDGVYVCQHCGTKYATEDARKLLVTIDGPVRVEGIPTIDNLLDRAQEFFDKGYGDKASEYIDRVLDIDFDNKRARDMQRALEQGKAYAASVRAPTAPLPRSISSRTPKAPSPLRQLGNKRITEDRYQRIVSALRSDRKLYAADLIRESTGWDDKECTRYIEDVLMPSLGLASKRPVGEPSASDIDEGTLTSPKSKWVAFFLCLLFGWCGAHCFYVRRYRRGIVFLLTFGLCLFGMIFDFCLIPFGKFKDADGRYITR